MVSSLRVAMLPRAGWDNEIHSMNPDGSQPWQLYFDQDHNHTPSVLPNGEIVYLRWDHTGINHIYSYALDRRHQSGAGSRQYLLQFGFGTDDFRQSRHVPPLV